MSQTGSYISTLVWETTDAEGPTRSEYQINWNAMDGHLHDNRGAGRGIRAIQTTATPTQTGDIVINGDALQWWGATSNSVITAVNPNVAVASLLISGPAAVANTRFCGILSTSGAPTTGTWQLWDFGYDEGGGIWLCTVAGSPGTWIQVGGPMTGDLKTTLRNTSDAGWVLGYGQTVNANAGTVYANLYTYANTNGLIGAGLPFSGTQAALVLPDFRDMTLVGLDNMGGSAKNVIAALNGLGKTTGAATHALTGNELPATAPWSITVTDPGHHHADGGSASGGSGGVYTQGGQTTNDTFPTTTVTTGITAALANNASGGQAMSLVQPSYGVNIQIKL